MDENSWLQRFKRACADLHDSKVKTRKQGFENLSTLLENPNLIKQLNDNVDEWNEAFTSIKTLLYKEMTKLEEELRKKGKEGVRSSAFACESRDLLHSVVKNANNKRGIINFNDYYRYLKDCKNNPHFKKHCLESCLSVFEHSFLMIDSYWDQLVFEEIISMKNLFKALHEENPSSKALRCYNAVLLKGADYKLPLSIIKQEIVFVRSVISELHSAVRWKLETSAQLFLIFCQTCGASYRQLCTTEGENALCYLFSFYNPHDSISIYKTTLMEIMLLQLEYHEGIDATPRWGEALLLMGKLIKSSIDLNDTLVFTDGSAGVKFNENLIQVVLGCYKQSYDAHLLSGEEPDAKRARKDATFMEIFNNIEINIEQQWILLFSFILEKYPSTISESYFRRLLTCFSNYVKDSKSMITRGYVFKCLSALIGVEEHLSANNDDYISTTSEWLLAYDSAIRTIGLNQNATESHQLVQLILKIKKHSILSPEDDAKLWTLYKSHTIQISEHSLKTFHTFASYHGLGDNSQEFKSSMINFILQTDISHERRKYSHFSYAISSEVVVNLTFKYYTNAESTLSVSILNILTYNHLLSQLNMIINQVMQKNTNDYDVYLNCIHLLVGLMFYYQKFNTNATNLMKISVPIIQTTWQKMITFFGTFGNFTARKITDTMNLFHSILKMDENLGVIKKTIDMSFIESLVDAQCDLDSESTNLEDPKVKLKLLIVKILTVFAVKAETEEQKTVQLMLYEFDDFDPCNDVDYQQAMIILDGIASENCQLDIPSVTAILILLKKICNRRFQEYNVCIDVLRALRNAFFHLIRMDDLTGLLKNDFMGIFKTLHHVRRNYGYKVELALVNCIDCLLQGKTSLTWAKYNDEFMVGLLPYYLESESLTVQQQAIKTISLVFEHVSNNSETDRFKSQIFKKILEKFDSLLPGDDSDLLVNFHQIVLQLLTNITISARGTKFTKKALCELFVRSKTYNIPIEKVIVEVRRLENNQIDINSHINMILQRWCGKYSILEFPYTLCMYNTTKTFYLDNLSVIIPMVLKSSDEETLEVICKDIGKTMSEVIEECYPKFLASSLIEQTLDSNKPNNKTMHDTTMTGLTQVKIDQLLSSDKGKQLTKNSIDDIIIEIARYVHDPVHFEQFFNFNICLAQPEGVFITYAVFIEDIMSLLTAELSCNVVKYLMEKKPSKLQQILLKLKYNIWEKPNAEDKLIEFYRYAIFVQYLLEHESIKNFVMFILRDVIYANINLIKHEDVLIQTLAMKYLSKFIEIVIPKYTKHFAEFIIVICSCMMPHAIQGNTDALNVLRAIIFSNNENINNHLQYLDPLPEDNEHLYDLRERHIKFRMKNNSLENEIILFLVGKQFKDSRTEGLKYLREKLKNNVKGLKNIYLKLHEMRGILSKDSILHSLITTLVVLVKSKDEEESMEAVKVLGILGASDLTTMVLKSEDVVQTKDCSWYLFTTKILELLSGFMVDKNLEVAQSASKALHAILSTEEGRNIIKNESVFATTRGFFLPFISRGSGKAQSLLSVSPQMYNETLCDEELWCPERSTHEEWIKALVMKILEGFTHHVMKCLIPIVCKKASFAEELFPFLIHLLMDTTPRVKNLVGVCIKSFFEQHWSLQCQGNEENTLQNFYSVAMNISSIRCILNTIHFVRLQRLCDKRGKYQELEMDLNYLHVAKAAEYCSAHFSALMYSEKWYHAAMDNADIHPAYYGLSPISLLDEIGAETSQLRFILTQAYKGIGDNYALFGGHLDDIFNAYGADNSKVTENNQDFQLLHRDMALAESAVMSSIMTSALKMYALYNLAISTANQHNDYGDAYYECMWRLSQWDLPNHVPSSNSFEFNIYTLLNAVNDDDKTMFDSCVKKTRLQVAQSLKTVSLESCKTLYGPLSQLERLQELEDIFTTAKENGDLKLLIDEFKVRDEIRTDYQYFEPRIAQRIEAINLLQKREFEGASNTYVEMSLNFADISRKHGNLQVSKRILSKFANLDDSEVKAKVALLDAQIHWKMGQSSSINKLKKLLKSYGNKTKLRSTILKLCGEWMVENHSEFPQKILTEYFLPCVDILNSLNTNNQNEFDMLHDVYKTLAKFADEEYQHISRSIKSPEFERKVASMNKMKECAKKLQTLQAPAHDIKKAIITYERMTNIDAIDVKTKYVERETFLKVAMKYYLYNMKYSQHVQMEIFRIFSLWLENKTNEAVITEIELNLLEVESYKVLTILPQLVPHISTENDRFSTCITQLIEKCAKEHPHHAIPLILSVANTNLDDNYSKENAKTSSNESRIRGAKNLITKLRNIEKYKIIIEENEKMAAAFIELAYYKVKADKNAAVKIPRSYKINNIKEFVNTLVPTYNLAYRPNLNYANIVGISKFKQEFRAVGGVNAPKRLECLGTDGNLRYILVKGQDDIRQDAVMQQVFLIMNEILRGNKETVNFKIRTYKVVPLSKRSGVLEWVDDTMPIGQYLAEAHSHYHPRDKKLDRARIEIKDAVSSGPKQRLKTYLDICERIHPVFHKFFETNFLEPTVWYEKRRAYTQSVATSSMCGYVLGIGDRHVHNILIDTNTAEVVHIDFGIAFEQGRILPTPETVPFRLTRDIVDGMGICGVEGTFRRTCERTMEALRRNAITIQTIVEVLLYDPLYDWSISPTQAYSKQMDEDSRNDSEFFTPEDDVQMNVSAERALVRLKHKLIGVESGNNTNVETQVDRLIQQAREPSNLSKLFYGWQAFL